jgi:histidyl-tRNA synthetase
MSKREQPNRLRAALPRGLRDAAGEEVRATRAMLDAIAGVCESYGFEPLATPALEFTEALGKFLPDQDRPNEGVFSLRDDDGEWLSLRYDLTAPLARYVAENFDALPKPFRRYQSGPVWRNEKPGPGRFREFVQIDADTVGTASPAADAEMCMLAADALEAVGIARGDYVIRVSSRKLLDGVLDSIGVTDARQRLTVMRAVDKLDRLGIEGVRLLLGAGRKDESGDFTRGAGLGENEIELLLDFLQPQFPIDLLVLADGRVIHEQSPETDEIPDNEIVEKCGSNRSTIASLRELFDAKPYQDGLDELGEIADLAGVSGYSQLQICIDPSVVRGLEYYTGPVFEAELTFETPGEDGRTVRFGSVGGGGRYDGLVARFRGQDVPATGFSVGVSRLYAALAHLGRHEARKVAAPVVILAMDPDAQAGYQAMARELRAAGVRAEVYLGTSGMRAQMKYADRRGAPAVVIEGSIEREGGVVTVKDLIEGERLSGSIDSREEWTSERPAQETVRREKMVDTVLSCLARHGFGPGAGS